MLAPGAAIGPLLPGAAAHLGLRPGTLVVQGGADAFIGVIGLGVTEPGEMALITGSSHLHIGVADRVVHKPGVWGTYMDGVYPGKPVIEGGHAGDGLQRRSQPSLGLVDEVLRGADGGHGQSSVLLDPDRRYRIVSDGS